MQKAKVICLFWLFISAAVCSPLWGIILHDDQQPPTNERPPDGYVGKWNSNASCVAIDDDYVLTTDHQSDSASGNNIVQIEGTNYYVAQIIDIASDIRIARITDAAGQNPNLTEFSTIYSTEPDNGTEFTIGGYGMVRGPNLPPTGQPYGYEWAANPAGLNWGENETYYEPEYSDLLLGFFDGPSNQYEAAPARFDSGGGWFIKDTGDWKVVAISYSVQPHEGNLYQTWFLNPITYQPQPDYFLGWLLNSYKTTIENAMDADVVISGYVFDFNEPMESVKVSASNQGGYTFTDEFGYYELWVLSGWSGTITPSKSGYSFAPANRSYANQTSDINEQNFYVDTVLIDDFNDNQRNADWIILEDDHLSCAIEEQSQRLQIRSASDANYSASYIANEWQISSASDFYAKVDFHLDIPDANGADVFIKIIADDANYLMFAASTEQNADYWNYSKAVDGNVVSDTSARTGTDGTFYIRYYKNGDRLYISYNGYETYQAWQTFVDLIGTDWDSSDIQIQIGASSENTQTSFGQLWLDDFTINSGTLLNWPPRTDINSDGYIDWLDVFVMNEQWLFDEPNLEADIDDNNEVNFYDFGRFSNVW